MGYPQYRFIKNLNMKNIYQKCIDKFGFDLEQHVDKKTMIININDINYNDVMIIIEEFIGLLGLIEEVN